MAVFEEINRKVIKDLEQGLPNWLSYHNVSHTKYVLNRAEEIAVKENITGRDFLLIKVAALYHDVGFLEKREDHEMRGCRIFKSDSKEYDFSPVEIEKICQMIMATHMPQKAQTILQKIVADADLEYLGTENFESFSKNLYQEILHYEPKLTPRQWDELQIKFLSEHRYHTNYCNAEKEPVKQRNLMRVKERLMAHKK